MADYLSRFLSSSLDLGGGRISGRLALAPMAGLTHVAFREVLEDFGGFGLSATEMCSARALPSELPGRSPVYAWTLREKPHLLCQIMGGNAEDMVAAARKIEQDGLFGVDINLGCAASAICRRGAGAALLRNPEAAERIVRAVRRTVSCPITVKFRTGWQDDPNVAAEMGRRLEAAGADGLVFHPRVAPDRRSRPPKWRHIAEVKRAVSIPVLGNGNVFNAEDAVRMLDTTGCDGIALGRIAVARPWIFAQLSSGFQPESSIFASTAKLVTERIWAHFEPSWARKRYAKFMTFFSANFVFGHNLKRRLCRSKTLEEAIRDIDRLLNPCPSLLQRPDAHLFTS